MILIADSGSSKTDWCLIDPSENKTFFSTEGYNPFYMEPSFILKSIQKDLPATIHTAEIKAVYFYGAGCQGSKIPVMEHVLAEIFAYAIKISVEVDLMGAARALMGNGAGFAAILGTGTNSCLYDGVKITHHIDSLGFLLGDEGSGAMIGKRIISDYLRKNMPEDVQQTFKEVYNISDEMLLNLVYNSKNPNRYCASYAKFLDKLPAKHPYGQALVHDSFDFFFKNLVSVYPDYQFHEFNCIGSIGYTFQSILIEVANKYHMRTGKIIPSVIADLADYHMASYATLHQENLI